MRVLLRCVTLDLLGMSKPGGDHENHIHGGAHVTDPYTKNQPFITETDTSLLSAVVNQQSSFNWTPTDWAARDKEARVPPQSRKEKERKGDQEKHEISLRYRRTFGTSKSTIKGDAAIKTEGGEKGGLGKA